MTSTKVEVQLMLGLMERMPGSFVQIQSAKSNKEIIQIKKKVYRENYLTFSVLLFEIYYSIHGLLVVDHFRNGYLKLSGPLLAYLVLEYTLLFCGLVIHKTVPWESTQLVAAFNQLYTEPYLLSSTILIMFMRWARWTYGSAIFMFIILFICLPYNPWTFLLTINQTGNWTLHAFIKICTSAYGVWTFATFGGYAVFIYYYGMACGYAGIQILTKELLTRKFDGCKTIKSYKKVVIHVAIVNACYQRIVAISFKLIVMPMAVVLGAVMIKPTIRTNTSIDVVFILGYLGFSCYLAMSFTYYFPGRANSISRKIISKWKSDLVLSFQRGRHEFKVTRKELASIQEIKIRFGSVSFYERGTIFVIVNFLLEKTVSLSLLM